MTAPRRIAKALAPEVIARRIELREKNVASKAGYRPAAKVHRAHKTSGHDDVSSPIGRHVEGHIGRKKPACRPAEALAPEVIAIRIVPREKNVGAPRAYEWSAAKVHRVFK